MCCKYNGFSLFGMIIEVRIGARMELVSPSFIRTALRIPDQIYHFK